MSDQQTDLNNQVSIMVVEDDVSLRSLFQRYLGMIGYKTIILSDASSALESLESNFNKIKIILSDVNLPGMDGYQLLEKVRQNYPSIKVIFLTGLGGELESGNESLRPDALIKKPMTLEEVKSTIDRVLTE